jgi:Protein of unknown function (DUF3093)
MRTYEERLWAPGRWWVVGGFVVVAAWLFLELVGDLWAWVGAVAALAVTAASLVTYGAVRVSVSPDGLRAGKAVLPLAAVGEARALARDEAARLRGPGFEPRAYHLIRAYVGTAVRVEVADRSDPTPYWYIATRHPDRLVAALEKSRHG